MCTIILLMLYKYIVHNSIQYTVYTTLYKLKYLYPVIYIYTTILIIHYSYTDSLYILLYRSVPAVHTVLPQQPPASRHTHAGAAPERRQAGM